MKRKTKIHKVLIECRTWPKPEESIMCWKCRVDLVGKTNPPINFSIAHIFLAENQREAILDSVEYALRLFNEKHYRFISEVVVSKYFINRPQNGLFTSGQGVSMFWWRHDNPLSLEDAAKKACLEWCQFVDPVAVPVTTTMTTKKRAVVSK